MRSFPNTLIASPSNNEEVEGTIDYLLKNPQPSYLRLDKSLELSCDKKIKIIKPGKWVYYKKEKNNNKLILSTGSVFKSCRSLIKKKYKDYDWATLPLWGMKFKDYQFKKITKYNKIVTVENHLQDGGFGSWLGEILIKRESKTKTKILSKFLSEKVIGKVGSENYLNSRFGLY